jgi:predicted phosphoribosyltransferase
MATHSLPTPRQALLVCINALVAALACAGVMVAAALTPAPTAVMPIVVVVCIACPMLSAVELPAALSVLRRRNAQALAELRRTLDALPETEHPLGL